MVTASGAVWVKPPPVAVRERLYMPGAVLAVELTFNEAAPDPGAARLAGVKLAVRPDGSAPADSATVELKPPLTATFRGISLLDPWIIDSDGAPALNLNDGVAVVASPQ